MYQKSINSIEIRYMLLSKYIIYSNSSKKNVVSDLCWRYDFMSVEILNNMVYYILLWLQRIIQFL